jgi:predicted DNA repair protein MutK
VGDYIDLQSRCVVVCVCVCGCVCVCVEFRRVGFWLNNSSSSGVVV